MVFFELNNNISSIVDDKPIANNLNTNEDKAPKQFFAASLIVSIVALIQIYGISWTFSNGTSLLALGIIIGAYLMTHSLERSLVVAQPRNHSIPRFERIPQSHKVERSWCHEIANSYLQTDVVYVDHRSSTMHMVRCLHRVRCT